MSKGACYRFRSHGGTPDREESRAFFAHLRRALRAAHGLRIPLELGWWGGTTDSISLVARAVTGDRWVQFGLSPAYEAGQWRPGDSPERRLWGNTVRTVRCGGEVGLPFPIPGEEGPWSESVVEQLGGSRARVAVLWELQPDPVSLPGAPPPTSPRTETEPSPSRPASSMLRSLEDRAEARRHAPRWRVKGDLLARPDSQSLLVAGQVAALIESVSHLDGGNRLVCIEPGRIRSLFTRDIVLTEPEILSLFPVPRSPGRPANPDPAGPWPSLWLGRDLRGGSVGLPMEPANGRHLVILGETGMGKSSLLVRLAWEAARHGSVVLFDPVGETAKEFVRGIPPGVPALVQVGPDHPGLTLNVLREVSSNLGSSTVASERALADVIGALRRVRAGRYPDASFWGPRLEEMLFHALRAASLWPEPSLVRAERLLERGPPRLGPIPDTARDSVSELRRRLELTPQDGEGARRLLSEITRSGTLRSLLDAESPTWCAGQAVQNGRLTVISGAAQFAGESVARYLLAVLLALVWNAVLVRPVRDKIFLVLDEVQWYGHESVAEMLRLGRRFNLHIWAATQSFDSLPTLLQEALRTNSADLVVFRGDPAGLRDLARWAPEVRPEAAMRLRRGEAAVLVDKGAQIRWIALPPPSGKSLRPDPATEPTSDDRPRAHPQPPGPPPDDTSVGADFVAEAGPWSALRQYVDEAGHGTELTVRLRDLRVRCSEAPEAAERMVRDCGRALSSRGLIVRSGRDEVGSYWVLSVVGLRALLAEHQKSLAGPDPGDGSEEQAF